ncbi:AfsR/SARP family transcriptional regulator [Ideonella sp. BN130291]|uniref:AfsR/SARP family transcriptional regulator n=1 Tax=Ideonella sp. BN130291 TaxID=3112940 RepID=UPI002E2750E9|nr:BTAD domain-containing putative transcriptional regulator [Ideonella sp. BN130291]
MLRLHLFGALSFSFEGPGADVRSFLHVTGRPGSLLAFLALAHGRYFSRGELVSALWGDQAEGVGSGTFNTVLWRLRKLMECPPLVHGALITCDRHGAVGLDPQARIALDVDEFARLVLPALAKPLEHTTEDDVQALRRGIELYTADILTDLADEWALREREKHRRHRLNALGRLMQICTLGRDHASAIRYAQAILDQDALREDVHRDLMRLFLASGQRALALRQFEQCRAALKQELAIQPMHETIALYQGIADHAVRVEGPPTLEDLLAPRAAPALPALVGAAPLSARELVECARAHLAQAEAQLQLTLPFL